MFDCKKIGRWIKPPGKNRGFFPQEMKGFVLQGFPAGPGIPKRETEPDMDVFSPDYPGPEKRIAEDREMTALPAPGDLTKSPSRGSATG